MRAIWISGATAAAVLTACGEPPAPAAPPAEPPPAASAAAPSPSPQFTISGQDLTLKFAYGSGQMRIPDNWRKTAASDVMLEIESQRHLADPDRWAMCQVMQASVPNLTLISQDGLNGYMERLWETTAQDISAESGSVVFTYPMFGDNVRAKRMAYTTNDTDFIVHGIYVANGLVMHGVLIYCDTNTPTSEQDLTDIDGFASSFRHIAP